MEKNEERLLKKYATILTNEYIEEREIISLRTLLERDISNELRKYLNGLVKNYSHKITSSQAQKGLSWLLNQWKTPTGKARKHNPFNDEQQAILQDFKCFYFVGTKRFNQFNSYYSPIYRVFAHTHTKDILIIH